MKSKRKALQRHVIKRDNPRLYEIHKKTMSKITNEIDNDAPSLPIESVTLTGKAMNDASRFKCITVENRMLINRIVKMFRTKGVIDSYNEKAGRMKSKLWKEIAARKRNDMKNLEMLMRLLKTKASYNTNDLLRYWESHTLKVIRNICKRPVMLKDLFPKVRRYYEMPLTSESSLCTSCQQNLLVYTKFKQNQKLIGRIIFKLFKDTAPKCTKMFLDCLRSCCSSKDKPKPIKIQWIFSETYMVLENTTETKYSLDYVHDECNCHRTSSRIGTLAVTVTQDKSLSFIVTFQPLPVLHENYATFGYVVHGFNILKHIEYFGHRLTGRPSTNFCICEAGSILE